MPRGSVLPLTLINFSTFQDFEEFVQGSGDEGVLVFSVSTLVNTMDDDMADMLAGALARLPLRVVWKYVGTRQPATLGNNTLLASWLPQNDLLGKLINGPLHRRCITKLCLCPPPFFLKAVTVSLILLCVPPLLRAWNHP